MAQEPDDSKVAPILTIEKTQYFLLNVAQTLFGVSLQQPSKVITFIGYFLAPLAIILCSALIADVTLCYILGTVLPTGLIILLKAIEFCIRKREGDQLRCSWRDGVNKTVRGVLLAGYSWLVTRHLREIVMIESYNLFGLSIVTLTTSMSTLHSTSVKEFGMQSEDYLEIGWDSTAIVRPLISIAVLISEAIVSSLLPTSPALPALQYGYSLLWLSWTLGLVSSPHYSLQLILQSLNNLIFGQQKKHRLSRTSLSLFLNAFTMFVIHTNPLDDFRTSFIVTNSLIILVSFGTSMGVTNWLLEDETDVKGTRRAKEYVIEVGLLIGKVGMTVLIAFVNPSSTDIMVVLGIDIGVYLICMLLLDLGKGRTHFGTLGNPTLNTSLAKTAIHYTLRTMTDISFTLLCYNAHIQTLFMYGYWHELSLRILTYRSYKRSIYNPLSFSIPLSFLLSLILSQSISLFWIPLLMIPLPDLPSMQLFSLFTIPKKNLHRNETLYKVMYFLASMIGWLLCLATADLLEPIMMFGLPVFLWSVPYYRVCSYSAQGKEKSIYQNLVRNLPEVVRDLDCGIYLIRISKYLTLARVIEKGIGYQIVEFRGLQSQQVTSCHNIQSQTIDNLCEQTWGANPLPSPSLPHLLTSLRPLSKHPHSLFQQNQIKLTGILQSEQFVKLLKGNFLKLVLMHFAREGVSKHQLTQMKKIKSNVRFVMGEKEAEQIYPHAFAKGLGVDFDMVKKESIKESLIVGERLVKPVEKLPPVREPVKVMPQPQPVQQPEPKPKPKPRRLFDDFDFMVEDQPKKSPKLPEKQSKHQPTEQGSNTALVDPFKQQVKEQVKQPIKPLPQSSTGQSFPQKAKIKLLDSSDHQDSQVMDLTHPCYPEVATTLLVYCLGRSGFLDQKKLYQLMRSPESAEKVLKSIDFDHKGQIALIATRAALKLSIDAFINGDFDELNPTQIIQQLKKSYVGVMEQKEFQEAIAEKREDIWLVSYKDGLRISRYAERVVDLYLFELSDVVAKSVWNNLRFELYYATNDDDERYSIQTHPHLLRNILIEGASQPLGYAPFYSGALKL